MIAGLEGIAMPPVTSPKLDATIWQSGRNPITTSSFLPPRTAGPARAWERVPVPAATRPCKIWKRTVGEAGTDAESLQNALSMAELESQGQGARKRARKIRHVPVWGDAQWDVRAEEPRDGSWDMIEARAAVAELQDELDLDVEQRATQSRTATYPEEKLRWVPRKRHNSRWPIEPTTTTTRTTMVAGLQPLVEFEIPTADIETAAAQHSPQRATDKQMRRRSTRRLSRRVSLAYIEDCSVYVSPIGRRISMVGATPTRSLPARKVATSPRKSFTLLASPSKVLFRPSASKARSPTRAVQTSPPAPILEAPEVDDSSLLSAESSILVFDQPVPDVQAEPAHEKRRRVSLQNAMRLDRPSTASRRSLDFGTAAQQPAPHRRHSFMPPKSDSAPSEIKSRRHTLDVFGENATVTTEMEQDEETTTGFSSAETTENISEVVVDVCANLDIFGTKSGITRRRKSRRASVHSDDRGDATSSPLSSAHYSSQNIDDSPLPIGLGITHETGVDGQYQAAMLDTSFNSHSDDCDDMADADTPNKDFWLDDGIGSTPQGRTNDASVDEEDVHQQEDEDMFAPHDPEGLSTIFEDEEVSFAQSSPVSQHANEEVEEGYRSSPSVVSEDIVSTEAETMSPTTTAELDEQIQDSPAAKSRSDDSVDEQETQSDEEHDEKMEQSFDFTLDAAEVAQRKATSVEPETVRSTTEVSNETTAEHPAMSSSPLSVRSFRDEELLVDGTIVVDDFSVHGTPARSEPAVSTTEQREEDAVHQEATSSPTSARSFCEDDGTMVVDDFSVPEASTTEQPADAAVQPAMSSPLSVRSFRDEEALLDGTIVVDDFSVHEPADAVQMESKENQQADGSEHYFIEVVEIASSPRSHIEVASSPAADVDEEDVPTSTPPQTTSTAELIDETEKVLDTPTSNGFKPINSDSVSPPVSSSPAKEAEDEDQDEADDLQDKDMALAMDYEPTVPINMDEDNITVQEAEPDAEPATEQEDSETEMLRKFVTRVSANKSAKAAAAALARRNLRPKRRSGSTGSTTSSTGSPVAKSAPTSSNSTTKTTFISSSSSDAQKSRFPLGEKDANSPSPTKKRKAHHGKSSTSGKMNSDDLFKGNEALYSAEISPPKSKRLRSRRKVEAQSDNKTSTSDEPTIEQQQSSSQDNMNTSLDSSDAPRRSTRSRNSRVQLKPPAPSANSIALSLIPVRLPGSSGMIMNPTDTSGDKDMPTPIVVSRTARTTAQEKDLAAVTRVNTRKNKAGAVPPKVILSRQAEDPLRFKLRELKGVFEAKEGREGSAAAAEEETTTSDEKKDGRKSRKGGKGVRWASELVRYNTDLVETPISPSRPVVALPLVPVRKGARKAGVAVPVPQQPSEDGDGYFPATGTGDENSPPPPVASATVAEEKQDPAAAVTDEKDPVKERDPEPKKSVPTRRTRQSRLQVPTPVSKKILAGGESGAAFAAGLLTTPAITAPTTAGKTTAAAGTGGTGVAAPPGSVVKMATRRTKIASLGMGVNGTPAPKRRTRA